MKSQGQSQNQHYNVSYEEFKNVSNGKKIHKCFLNNKQVKCNNKKFLSMKKYIDTPIKTLTWLLERTTKHSRQRQKTKKRR